MCTFSTGVSGRLQATARQSTHATAWPAECRAQLCRRSSSSSSSSRRGSIRVIGGGGSSSSSSSSSSTHGPNHVRSPGLRVLSSNAEPGSISSSLEEVAPTPAAAVPSTSDADDYGYMQEYAALKQQLLDNTRKSGGAIGAYLLFSVNGTAALLAMLGAGASYAYVAWLCRDVDAVRPTDEVPIWEANKIENVWLRRAAKVKAAYQKALRPRLLVPVGLGLLLGVYDRVTGEHAPLLYSGCLLLGFLSYKLALITKLVGDLMPKGLSAEAERPKVDKIEDELDQWGRPRRRLSNPIDVMPEDMQAKAYEQLEEQLAKEERRRQD